MVSTSGPAAKNNLQNWSEIPTYGERLKKWQLLKPKERNEIWLQCEKSDPSLLQELWKIEWQIAEDYFAQDEHKNELKMAHKNGLTRHSFIKVKNGIFMLARKDKELGAGAFGKVKPTYLKGEEGDVLNKNGESCIVKVIKTKTASDEQAVNKEALALDAIGELRAKEERIIKNNEKKFYLVAKRHPGRNLMKVILDNKLTYPQLLVIAYQCCELIDKAHKRGYLHLDIKSENFMVDTSNGEIKVALIDWGLAEKLPDGKNEMTVEMVGTPEFIAPEVLAKNPKASRASDVFSLGIMFKNDLVLIDTDYSAILNYDPNKRISLVQQQQKLLKTLDLFNDDEKDDFVKNFAANHPISDNFDDDLDAKDVEEEPIWQLASIKSIIADLKTNYFGDLGEGYIWLFTAKSLVETIAELTAIQDRPDLNENDKLELVEKVLMKCENKFYGDIKSIFSKQIEFLKWNRDYNRVFDEFLSAYSKMDLDQKEFFNKNIEELADAQVTIDSDSSLTASEKSKAFLAAIKDRLDFAVVNAIADPKYNLLIPILENAEKTFAQREASTDNLEQLIDEIEQDEAKDGIDNLLDDLDNFVATDPDLEFKIDEMQAIATQDLTNTLQMPQFDQFLENLFEFCQVNPDEKLISIIEILQQKIERPYYQKNPQQCIEAVMAENDEPMSTIEGANFLIDQLKPWKVQAPKLHEQIETYQHDLAEFEKMEQIEESKLAALKENIFDYAIYLFNQKECFTDDELKQNNAIINHIKNRKRIDTDNESFLSNLLSLQKNKHDVLRYNDIQDIIKEVCQQLAHEYHIDLTQLSDKNMVKNAVLAAVPEKVVKRPLPKLPPEVPVVNFNKLIKSDENFLKKHGIVNLLLNGLRIELSAKRPPSDSAYVLEMNTLVQKIEMLPDDMPQKIKLGVIKSYIAAKEKELNNAKLNDLQKRFNLAIANAIEYVNNSLSDVVWPKESEQVVDEPVIRELTQDESAGDQLFKQAIEFSARVFNDITTDAKIVWSEKPTKDDLSAVSKQLQQKRDLIQEGIIKINPQKELIFILRNASANPRLTKLIDKVASELNIDLFKTERVVESKPNKETIAQLKRENAARGELLEELKQNWKELAMSLVNKRNPHKNDYMLFSDERFNESMLQVQQAYETANPAKRHNLTTHVIPLLKQHYEHAKRQVANHYIAVQRQNIEKVKEEHSKIREKQNEAQKCKQRVLEKVQLQNPKQEGPKKLHFDDQELVNKKASLQKVVEIRQGLLANPLLQEIQGKKRRPLPEIPSNEHHVDDLFDKIKSVDSELEKEKASLKYAYNLIIAYDSTPSNHSIPFVVEQIVNKKRAVLAMESEKIQRKNVAATLPQIIQGAKEKAKERERLLKQQLVKLQSDTHAVQMTMLKNIELSFAPISLENKANNKPLPIPPITQIAPIMVETLVSNIPEVKKSALLSRPLPPAPLNVDAFLQSEIQTIQTEQRNKEAEDLISQHRDSFELNADDRMVIEKLKVVNQQLNEREQAAAVEDEPSLSSLSLSLKQVEDEHAATLKELNQQLAKLQSAHQNDIEILRQLLEENTAKRKDALLKANALSAQLETILKDPVSAYQAKLRHQEQTFARKWFKNQAKNFGRRVYGKERSRTKQTKFIQDIFLGIQQDIKSSDVLSIKEKAMVAYQCLAQVQKEILNEKNTFESDLFYVCDEQMKKLETILTDLSALEPPKVEKPHFTDEAFLKMVFYEPRNASDKELPLETRIIQNCKKYNQIPQDYTQLGDGGTLTMLEGIIKREKDQIDYFAQFGQGSAKLEAIKLQAKLRKSPEIIQFQEKAADRAMHMAHEIKKPHSTNNLSGAKLQEHRKKMIDEKVAKLKNDHFNETSFHSKKTNH